MSGIAAHSWMPGGHHFEGRNVEAGLEDADFGSSTMQQASGDKGDEIVGVEQLE
jgi:hypothetical protein